MLKKDIASIIQLARKIKNVKKQDEVVALFNLLNNLNLRQQYDSTRQKAPPEVIATIKKISAQVGRASKMLESGLEANNIEGVLEEIIALEQLISKQEKATEEKERITTHQIKMLSPAELVNRRILLRGASQEELTQVERGWGIYAKTPAGPANESGLVAHVLQTQENTPFISLTSDFTAAKYFGAAVLVVKIDSLQGQLHLPEEIDAALKRAGKGKFSWTRAKKLRRKNSEFILGPTTNELAYIPPQAILRVLQ